MFIDAQLYSTDRRRQKAPAAEEMENLISATSLGSHCPIWNAYQYLKYKKLNIQTSIT